MPLYMWNGVIGGQNSVCMCVEWNTVRDLSESEMYSVTLPNLQPPGSLAKHDL